MSAPTFVETWICLARAGEYDGVAVDAMTLRAMAEQFNGPMPVDVDFRAFDPGGPLLPPSGAQIVQVEVRRDERGAYLAGLFRSPSVTVAIHTERRDPITGSPLPPKLSVISFTNKPTKRTNDSEL